MILGLAMSAILLLAACASTNNEPGDVAAPAAAPGTLAPTTVSAPTALPPTAPAPTATPVPTATPAPTATPIPEADMDEVLAEFGVDLLNDQPTCSPVHDLRTDYPPRFERTCTDATAVTAPADGIVVGLGNGSEPRNFPAAFDPTGAPANQPNWAWSDLDAMGDYVIIDHGMAGRHLNVTTIIWGFKPATELGLGTRLTAGETLGLSTPGQPVHWQLWTGEVLFGFPELTLGLESFNNATAIAEGLSPFIAAPVGAPCTVNLGASSQLPNAGRPYRSGTHRGVDLICGTPGNDAFAVLDGTVVAVVSDYEDSPVQPRLDVLNNAAIGGGTPQWTLNLLYGNFVVIEHEDPNGREVLTISAHMETVEPKIVVGYQVSAGELIGEVGNRGTGASAAGSTAAWDSSRHLHWEIFVDGVYLGAGLGPGETSSLYRSLLCGAAPMNGC